SIVKRWRARNAWAPEFWYATSDAAASAVDNPGTVTESGRMRYSFYPALLGGTLLCFLPGDVVLSYPQAKIEYNHDKHSYDLTAIKATWKPKADSTVWPRVSLWHGLLVENGTQALCAGVLRHALRKFHYRDVVMHTHDEIVDEVHEEQAAEAVEFMAGAMGECAFTPGLPLHVDPFICWRYGHKPED
ncbi:unnamed protein product, partial [marine sediment metagenome]